MYEGRLTSVAGFRLDFNPQLKRLVTISKIPQAFYAWEIAKTLKYHSLTDA